MMGGHNRLWWVGITGYDGGKTCAVQIVMRYFFPINWNAIVTFYIITVQCFINAHILVYKIIYVIRFLPFFPIYLRLFFFKNNFFSRKNSNWSYFPTVKVSFSLVEDFFLFKNEQFSWNNKTFSMGERHNLCS